MADLLRGKWSMTGLASPCTDMPTSLILSEADRKSTRLNSSHSGQSRMPSSA